MTARTVILRGFPGIRLVAVLTLLFSSGTAPAIPPGDFSTPEFQVNTRAQNDQRLPVVDADAAGNLIVAWQSRGHEGPSWSVVAQRYDANLQPVSQEQQLNASSQLRRDGPAIAMADDGRFVAAWHGPPREAMLLATHQRAFDPDGTALHFDHWVSSDFGGQHVLPDIGMAGDGRYTLVWDADNAIGNTFNVLALDFDATGSETGAPYVVNQYMTGAQRYSRIGANAAGDRVIAWQSSEQDGSGWGIFARCLPAAGPPGDEFQVNTFTHGNQVRPKVAVAPDGAFAITWYDNRGQSFLDYARVNLRLYDAGCQPLSPEIRANQFDAGIQDMPSITVDDSGHYTVVWQSFGPDEFETQGIYGRRFNAFGQPLGDEFRVNQEVEAYQDFPAVQALPDRGFLVVWETLGQDGSGFGIYARRYAGPQPATTETVSGTGQQATVGQPFAQPLTVRVLDQWGQPLAGVAVTFRSASSGAGALFPNGQSEITVMTDATGLASVTLTANQQPGAHRIDVLIDSQFAGPSLELINQPAAGPPEALPVNTLGPFAQLLLVLLLILLAAPRALSGSR